MNLRPRITEDEREILDRYRGIKKASENADVNCSDVKHGWLKQGGASLFFTNPEYNTEPFDPNLINWDFINKGLEAKPTVIPVEVQQIGVFDRLVITDTHIGMDTNKEGDSLYGGKWNLEELNDRKARIIQKISKSVSAPILCFDDLGDLLDGWNAQTVRKGHSLPQNMSNVTAFDVALNFKLDITRHAAMLYENVIINNICNDNHSGDFGEILNNTFKKIAESLFPNVEITNHRKFINHYTVGKNTFIISHGKDKENLKFGFKPFLDKPQMEKIDNYIDHNYLLQPGVKIEFSKGDSHQQLFDSATSQRFDYFNYCALSPASNWVQANYKIGKSGFTFFNYLDTNEKITHEVFFDWKK